MITALILFPLHTFGKSKRSRIPRCKSKQVLYKVSPVELEDIDHIIPLGNVSPPFHIFPVRHLYFHIKKSEGSDRITKVAPVYSPGKVWVTSIESMTYLDKNDNVENEDYRIVFSPCKEFESYFIHLSSITEKLKNALQGENSCSESNAGTWKWISCSSSTNIKLKPGELIGTAGGDFTNALDFGSSDFRTSDLNFARPDRWENDGVNTVCSLDYYPKKLKRSLEQKLGDNAESSKIEPLCGKVDWDIAGTAQGNWFVKDTQGPFFNEDPHLALVYDNINPNLAVISLGNSFESNGINSKKYTFTPNDSGFVNRKFKDITNDGNVYCFETDSISILLELTSKDTLRMEKNIQDSCGEGPWSFESTFVDFER